MKINTLDRGRINGRFRAVCATGSVRCCFQVKFALSGYPVRASGYVSGFFCGHPCSGKYTFHACSGLVNQRSSSVYIY